MDKKGHLEVEVIRARGLTPKPGSKSLPGESVPTCNYLSLVVDNSEYGFIMCILLMYKEIYLC